MELINDNLEPVKLLNIKGSVENVTPHKIAVVAFIREYGLLKIEEKQNKDCVVAPKYRKDFCILSLKLIQCPDMEFKELETLLTDGRYNLLSVHLQNFCVRLQNIYVNGISALMDCVTSTVDKLMIEPNETNPCVITRYSVLGFYLRRILLHLDKLTFMQVVSLYKSFCLYYQRGRPGLMMRSFSKEKLNNMEFQIISSNPEETKSHEFSMKMNIIDKDNSLDECHWSRKQAELFTAQQANLLQINERQALPPRQLQKTISQIINDIPEYPDVHFLSFLNCIRSKEFCGAQDSLYNCFDRTVFSVSGNNNAPNDRNKNFRYAALNRAAMHTQFGHKSMAMEGVREALSAAQEAADAWCLAHAAAWGALAGGRARRAALLARVPRAPRVAAAAAQLMAQHAAVNGAKPAEVLQSSTEPNPPKCYRYTNISLYNKLMAQHAAVNGAKPAEVTPPSTEPNPRKCYRYTNISLYNKLMAQHAAVNGAKPAEVLQIITKGDSLNYMPMTDLTMAGLANQAALWALYGKTEMASVCCQLLLNLNTTTSYGVDIGYYLRENSYSIIEMNVVECGYGEVGAGSSAGGTWHWTESCGTAAAGAACTAAWRADTSLAAAIAAHLPSTAHPALTARHHAGFALLAGKWEEAEQSIGQLASFDRWESQLLKAEMYFLKGDATEALESLHDILDYCKTEDDSLHFISLRLKAMILMSQVQHSFSSIQSTNIMLLNEALSLAKKYHLHYLAAMAEMHIANVQLHMGCAKNALLLVRKVLPSIMAHGSTYDTARALLLYTKCRIASAPVCGEARAQVFQSCCDALETVKKNFSKVGAHSRLLQTWYLQAQLYNDIGNHAARNQCAWMYRQLEIQNPIEPSNTLLIMY
ncbi:unnamed protein product [Diatraea saccharalis]|uniref:Anaphase-promoting complex subunit 5 n=1 Tax=Diatraea saccharalis TaxID=40085 RepID=A0A9P0C738_9NEOP|nr:unnamed protein product [Diatraea saccharalis]